MVLLILQGVREVEGWMLVLWLYAMLVLLWDVIEEDRGLLKHHSTLTEITMISRDIAIYLHIGKLKVAYVPAYDR